MSMGDELERTLREEIAAFKARVDELEDVLISHSLPYNKRTCECCLELYMPNNYDSCRCWSCCMTCHYSRDAKEWVHGPRCPKTLREAKEKENVK